MLTGERGSTKQFVERTVWHPCYAVNILRKGGHKGEGNMGGTGNIGGGGEGIWEMSPHHSHFLCRRGGPCSR